LQHRDHAFIESGARIGDRLTIKNQAMVWDGVEIGDDVFVGPGVGFTNDIWPLSRRMPLPAGAARYQARSGWLARTRVGNGATLGARCVILPDADIGGLCDGRGGRRRHPHRLGTRIGRGGAGETGRLGVPMRRGIARGAACVLALPGMRRQLWRAPGRRGYESRQALLIAGALGCPLERCLRPETLRLTGRFALLADHADDASKEDENEEGG
jgi:hypothetical protein